MIMLKKKWGQNYFAFMTYFKNNRVVFKISKDWLVVYWSSPIAGICVTFLTQKIEYLHVHYFKYVDSMQQ